MINTAARLLKTCIDTHALYDMDGRKHRKLYRAAVDVCNSEDNKVNIRLLWHHTAHHSQFEKAETLVNECLKKVNEQLALRKRCIKSLYIDGALVHRFDCTDPRKMAPGRIHQWIAKPFVSSVYDISIDELIRLGFYKNHAEVILDIHYNEQNQHRSFFPSAVIDGQVHFNLSDCVEMYRNKMAQGIT